MIVMTAFHHHTMFRAKFKSRSKRFEGKAIYRLDYKAPNDEHWTRGQWRVSPFEHGAWVQMHRDKGYEEVAK